MFFSLLECAGVESQCANITHTQGTSYMCCVCSKCARVRNGQLARLCLWISLVLSVWYNIAQPNAELLLRDLLRSLNDSGVSGIKKSQIYLCSIQMYMYHTLM